PGDVIPAIGDGGSGLAVVVATSRHKQRLGDSEARDRLLAEAVTDLLGRTDLEPYRPAIAAAPSERWWSVTQWEIDNDCHDYCAAEGAHDAGSWCSGGSGKAWVDTIRVEFAALYNIDDSLAEEAPDAH